MKNKTFRKKIKKQKGGGDDDMFNEKKRIWDSNRGALTHARVHDMQIRGVSFSEDSVIFSIKNGTNMNDIMTRTGYPSATNQNELSLYRVKRPSLARDKSVSKEFFDNFVFLGVNFEELNELPEDERLKEIFRFIYGLGNYKESNPDDVYEQYRRTNKSTPLIDLTYNLMLNVKKILAIPQSRPQIQPQSRPTYDTAFEAARARLFEFNNSSRAVGADGYHLDNDQIRGGFYYGSTEVKEYVPFNYSLQKNITNTCIFENPTFDGDTFKATSISGGENLTKYKTHLNIRIPKSAEKKDKTVEKIFRTMTFFQ